MLSGAYVEQMFKVLGYLWDYHVEYFIRSGHNVYSIM